MNVVFGGCAETAGSVERLLAFFVISDENELANMRKRVRCFCHERLAYPCSLLLGVNEDVLQVGDCVAIGENANEADERFSAPR